MLIAHAEALAEARSCLAALAHDAQALAASVEYERILLQLDAIHGNDAPALETAGRRIPGRRADRANLYVAASSAIEQLLDHGVVDQLQIELVLDMLDVARDNEQR